MASHPSRSARDRRREIGLNRIGTLTTTTVLGAGGITLAVAGGLAVAHSTASAAGTTPATGSTAGTGVTSGSDAGTATTPPQSPAGNSGNRGGHLAPAQGQPPNVQSQGS